MSDLQLNHQRFWNPVVVCPQCGGFLNLHNSNVCFNCGFIYVLKNKSTEKPESSKDLFESSSASASYFKENLEKTSLEAGEVIKAVKHYNAGMEYGKAGDLKTALKEFRTAIKLNKFHLNSHIAVGIVLARMNRIMEAEAEWKFALSIDPENKLVKRYLSILKADKKRK